MGVPYIMMHMRGDPSTMQSAENTTYEDVCADVGRELQCTAAAAIRSGIEPWRIIPDPGETLRCVAKGLNISGRCASYHSPGMLL